MVGHLEDVVEVVRDHQHRSALIRKALDEVEDHPGLRHAERGSRLVHDDEPGRLHDGLRDGDGLALPPGQRCHGLADGADRGDVQIGEGLAGRQFHGRLVQEAVPEPLVAEEHVLDDVQVVAQREILVDRRDAEILGVLRPVETYGFALPEDLALAGLPQSGNGLDRHRLAGAVVARERGDLSGRHLEVDLVEGLDGAEHLAHAPQLQQRHILSHFGTPVAAFRRIGAAHPAVGPRPQWSGGRAGSPFRTDTTQEGPSVQGPRYGVMPAAVQSAWYCPAHNCDAGTKLSLMTVAFMFFVVTHVGTSAPTAR